MDQTLNIRVEVIGSEAGAVKIQGLATATEEVGTATEETSKKTSALGASMKGLATGFAVYKGYQFIKDAVTETGNLARGTMQLQKLTGLDTNTASAWVATAQERGIQSKALNTSFVTLAKQTVALANGTKATSETFKSLGINTGAFLKMNTEQRMLALADALKNTSDPATRAADAQKLFGRNAQALLPLLSQGSSALKDQITEMGKHTNMSAASLKQQLALVKAQREWNATMLQVKVALATALVPILTALMQLLGPLIQDFATLMQGSGAFRIAILALTAGLITYIAITKLAKIASLEFEAATFGWIAIAVAIGVAVVELYKHCQTFRDIVQTAFHAIVDAFNWVKNAAIDVFNWVKANWPLLLVFIAGPFGVAAGEIINHFTAVKKFIGAAFDYIKGIAQSVAGFLSSVLGGAFDTIKKAAEGVVSAIKDILNTAKKITSLPGKVLNTITGGIGGAVSSLNPFGQTGLYASHAGTAIVGEHGPEMVKLPQGAQVHPFMQRSGSGGGAMTIHVPVYLDRRQIALAMGDYAADRQAAR